MTETLPILFFVTSLIVIVTPGQDMILVMSRSVAQGWKGGVVTAAGVSTGLLGHTAPVYFQAGCARVLWCLNGSTVAAGVCWSHSA